MMGIACRRRSEVTRRAGVRWRTEGDGGRSGRMAAYSPARGGRPSAAPRLRQLRCRVAREGSHTHRRTQPDRSTQEGSAGSGACDHHSAIGRAPTCGSNRLCTSRRSPCQPCRPPAAWGKRVRYRARRSRSRTMRPRLRPTRGAKADVASGSNVTRYPVARTEARRVRASGAPLVRAVMRRPGRGGARCVRDIRERWRVVFALGVRRVRQWGGRRDSELGGNAGGWGPCPVRPGSVYWLAPE